jgi:hypothetical protein
MATWELTTEYKKSSTERQFWYKDDKVIIREEGYRWATFTVESDDIPLTPDELRNEDDYYELGCIDNDECWEMVDMIDGCWADTEAGHNCTDEDLAAFEDAWEENWTEGVEELGWMQDDTEYFMTGPLKLTNLDTGVVYSGLTDPATIVHTIELPTNEVAPGLTPIVNESAQWPTPNSNFKETAKWPFEAGYVAPEPKVTGWFPVKVKPVRDGLYECDCITTAWPFPQVKKLEWHDGNWHDNDGNIMDKKQITQWRGLAKDPGVTNGN